MSYSTKHIIIRAVGIPIFIISIFVIIFSHDYQLALLLLIIFNGSGLLSLIALVAYIKNIDRILYRHCDPEKLLSVVLRNFPEKSRESRDLSVTYKIARGLCAAGRFEEALAELKRIDDFPTGLFGEPTKRFYYEYLVLIYTNQKDIAEAETALESLRQIAYDKELSIVKQKSIKKQYEESSILLDIAKGVYEDAEEFLTNKFIKAKNNYTRVFAKYYLGVVYSHLKEEAKAHEAFKYAAAHGNKLYIASLAAENSKLTEPA